MSDSRRANQDLRRFSMNHIRQWSAAPHNYSESVQRINAAVDDFNTGAQELHPNQGNYAHLQSRFRLNAQAGPSQSDPSVIVMSTTGSGYWREPLAGSSDTHQLHPVGTATNPPTSRRSASHPNIQQIMEQIREYIFDSLDLLVLFVDIFSSDILNWIVQRAIDHVKTELGIDIPTNMFETQGIMILADILQYAGGVIEDDMVFILKMIEVQNDDDDSDDDGDDDDDDDEEGDIGLYGLKATTIASSSMALARNAAVARDLVDPTFRLFHRLDKYSTIHFGNQYLDQVIFRLMRRKDRLRKFRQLELERNDIIVDTSLRLVIYGSFIDCLVVGSFTQIGIPILPPFQRDEFRRVFSAIEGYFSCLAYNTDFQDYRETILRIITRTEVSINSLRANAQPITWS